MNSRERRTIKFSTFVTYEEIEAAMQSDYSKSRTAKGIVFDLSATGWISPQALCTLHCWAFDINSLGVKVALLPPDGAHQASSFFSSAHVLSVLSRGSVFDKITEPSQLGARPRYLSSFQVFPNEEGLEKYLETLSDLQTRHLMLEMHDEAQLVDSGYYHDVLIRELVGNSFSHADGLGSMYASYGFESSGEQKSPLLASFTSEKPGESGSTRDQGKEKNDLFLPYAEICVADSYKSNLWNQISQLRPEDRIPELSYTLAEGLQDIKDHERDILAAFNYASTTDRSARMKRIQRYIRNWNGKASAIATGLYRVRRVVEQYGGQVIVRADKSLVSLDYSRITSDEPDPKVGCVRRLDGRKLAPLRGTLVCVRIPLEPMLRGREYAARKTRFSRKRGYKDPNIEIIAAPAASAKNGVGGLLGLDQFEEDARARFGKADESTFSFVLLDGLADEYQVSRNLLVPLIDLFSLVPRKCGLVVIADDETVAGVHKAAPLLLQTVAEQPLETRAGLVVVGSDDIDPCEIGDPHSSDATRLKGTEVISPSGVRISLKNVASKVRKKRLAEVLMSEPVLRKKEGHLYLIPNRYYTDRYFEIERVDRIPSAFSTLSQWLKDQVTKHQPSAIIVNSSFVLRAVDSAVKNASLATKPDLFRISRDSVLSVAAKCNAACGDTGTVLAVFDVVCTGDLIARFLNVFGRPSNVSIIALVDTRTAPAPFQVSEASRHVQVNVESIHQEPIEPIRDRGNTPAFKIHRADPRTHLLLETPKHDVPKRSLQAHENLALLEKAGRVNALATGHFTFHSQHHAYFLNLRPLFRAIETDIIKWLTKSDDSELTDLQNTLEVDVSQLQVFCLDADTGLYHIVSRALETTQCKQASLLTRSDLQHPLADHIHTGHPSWFIIPALVNGTSFYECLKLAGGAKAPLTRISVVLDRTNPRTAASLKGIRQFSKTKVQLSRMFTIPISLEDGTCSLCDRERRLQGAALACRHGRYPHLHAVLENASNAMRAVPVENPGLLGTAVMEQQSDRLPREFAVRSLLEQAVGGDIQATWDLRKHLVDLNGFSVLAAAATSVPNSLFTRERVADVLHEASLKAEREERLTLSEACTGWTEQASSEHNPDSFGRELRGFAQLDPFTLRAHISTLLKRIGDNPVLLAEVVAEAIIHPALYLDAVEKVSSTTVCADQDLRDTLSELKSFLTYEGGHVPDIHWLRHHLMRSSGWSYSLSRIQQEANTSGSTGMGMETICQVFLRQGLRGAQDRLAALRSGHHWESLQNAGDLETRWASVERLAKRLVEEIRSDHGGPESIARIVDEVDDATQTFVDALDNSISLAPEMIEKLFRASIGSRNWPDEAVNIIVPRDCKPIACGKEDFREVFEHLLDNARRYSQRDTVAITTLKFHLADPNASRVVMEVSQNSPVRIPDQKAFFGGLRRVEELLMDITGMPPVLTSCESNEAYLIVSFWAWPLQGGEKL